MDHGTSGDSDSDGMVGKESGGGEEDPMTRVEPVERPAENHVLHLLCFHLKTLLSSALCSGQQNIARYLTTVLSLKEKRLFLCALWDEVW